MCIALTHFEPVSQNCIQWRFFCPRQNPIKNGWKNSSGLSYDHYPYTRFCLKTGSEAGLKHILLYFAGHTWSWLWLLKIHLWYIYDFRLFLHKLDKTLCRRSITVFVALYEIHIVFNFKISVSKSNYGMGLQLCRLIMSLGGNWRIIWFCVYANKKKIKKKNTYKKFKSHLSNSCLFCINLNLSSVLWWFLHILYCFIRNEEEAIKVIYF